MSMRGGSIGPLVGTIVGAAVGALIPGASPATAALGASIGGLLGGVAGNLYDTAVADDILNEQQSIADLRLQTSTLGKPIPQVTGKNRLAGNVIWATQKQVHEARESTSASGKGGGPQQITVTKTYTISYAIAICDTLITGPITGISKAWRDTTLVYDRAQSAALPDNWAFYGGTAGQGLDPTMEAQLGTANTPAYRYLCYLVIADDDLGRSGRTYVYSFEVYQDAEASTPLATIAVSPTTGDVWAMVPAVLQGWRFDETTRELTGTVPVTAGGYPPPGAIMAPMNIDSSGRPWCGTISGDLALHHMFLLEPSSLIVDQEFDVTSRPASNIVFSGGDAWVAVSNELIATPTTTVKRLTAAGSIAASIAVDYATYPRLAVGLDGHIWASSAITSFTGNVNRINPASNLVIATITIGDWANDVYVSSGGDVWVPTYNSPTVKRISPGSNTIIATITVAARPWRVMEATDGYLWVACRSGAVSRINPADNSVTSYSVPGIIGELEYPDAFSQLLAPATSGAMWVVQTAQNAITRVSTTGTQLTVRTPAEPRHITPGASNTVWVSCRSSGGLVQVTDAGAISGLSTGNALSTVITNYCAAAGIAGGNLDLTDLPYALVNVTILNVQAVKTVLEMLAQAYRFYMIESGTKLKFRQRGSGSVVASISADDLDAGEETPGEAGAEITRTQQLDLPTQLDVIYIDPEQNYQQNTQRAALALQAAQDDNARVITTPLVLAASQAKQLAQELLHEAWIQRETLSTRVPRQYAHLEPGDRVTIAVRGISYSAVLVETTYGRPGILELTARPDAAAVVGALGAVPGVVVPQEQSLSMVGDTSVRLLNLPALRSNDQDARYHVAYVGANEPWEGGVLYRSVDAGASYQPLDNGVLEAITGTVASAAANADWHVLDTSTTITVVLEYGTLATISDLALYNGGNLCVLGSEILGFGVATLVGTRTYQLTRLLRGRRGTEWAVSTHGTNETFVLLDAAVHAVAMPLVDRYVTRPYKPVTLGQNIADASVTNFAPTGRNLDPWTVAQPTATRVGNDWVLTWRLRSRYGGDWVDGAGIGFDPDFIGFIPDIWSDNTYTVLKRSTLVDGGNPLDPEAVKTWAYTEAMQIADFGSAQSTIYYQIYQVTTNGLTSPVDNLVGV